MGRRSRKRGEAGAPAKPSAPAVSTRAVPRAVGRRARMEEAPQAVWSPFPLTELCILLSIVLISVGFFVEGDRRGATLAAGFVLIMLAGGELAVREHFAGFRSHSALLSGICAIAATIPLYLLTSLPQVSLLIFGALVLAVAFHQFRAAFARRAGGLGFRA